MDTFWGSHEQHEVWRQQRIANGSQPDLPFVNNEFLVSANIVYLGVTAILYVIMSSLSTKNAFKELKKTKETPDGKTEPDGSEPAAVCDLKYPLFVYNVICVFAAATVVFGIVKHKLGNPGKFVCNPIDRHSEEGQVLAWYFWVFYAQKFWEFIDTWGYLLRQSFRQVTFLHVFHHCSINIVVGVVLPYDYNGDMFLPILLNSTVHVLMYTHYAVSILGGKTPWRQYLTTMQLMQFCLISAQSVISLSRGGECGAPTFAKWIMIVYMMSMLVLFGDFYMKSYMKPNGVIKSSPGTPIQGGGAKKPKAQ